MVNEKSIGKKVWLLVDSGHYNFFIDKGDYTIDAIKPYNEVKDHCNHVVVKDQNGKTQELREYYVVFVPNPDLQGDEQIGRYLEDNGCYNDGVYTNTDGTTSVEISWGDWKHSHIWCDTLMRYLGYDTACEEEVTEENGSDCYSATHYFVKHSLESIRRK